MSRNNVFYKMLLYAFVFAGFLCMFYLMLPTLDVFVFYRASGSEGWTLSAALEDTLYYGNGRFLGNMLLHVMSHNFWAAGIFVALTFLSIVVSLNVLLFGNRRETIFPIALLIAMPSKGMITESYYMLASFINYIFPVALILVCMAIVRMLDGKHVQGITGCVMEVIIMILLYSACLFSENTSIVLAVIVAVYLAYTLWTEKRISIPRLLQGIAVVLGVATMFLIPPLTGTSHKLDFYRSVSTTFATLIDQAIGNYVAFATFFSTYVPVIALLSLAFVFVVKRECTSRRLSGFLVFTFVMYPSSCVAFTLLDSNPIRLNWIYLLQAVLLLLFIAAILLAALQIRDRRKQITVFALITVVFFTIAPMMVVSQYGYRTFYTTFVAALVLALYLIREFMPEKLRSVLTADGVIKRTLMRSSVAVFAFVSVFLFVQTLYNFSFYAVRAEDIIRQVETSDVIEVPTLPCRIASMEDIYYTSISFNFSWPADQIKLIDIYTGDNSEAYVNAIQASPVSALRTVIEHFECRDPGFFDKVLGS